METDRTDISRQEMNEFWEHEKATAKPKAIQRERNVEPGMKYRHKLSAHAGKTFQAASKKTNRDWLCIEEGGECHGHSFWDPNMYGSIAPEPRVPKVGETWEQGDRMVTIALIGKAYRAEVLDTNGVAWHLDVMAKEWTYVSGPSDAPKAAAPAKPAPRAHDFSNPYLIDTFFHYGRRLCVECGLNYEDKICQPRAGWREKREIEIAADTDHQARNRRLNRPRQPTQPYRNDVAGIGSVMGGYHNVAPERGRPSGCSVGAPAS